MVKIETARVCRSQLSRTKSSGTDLDLPISPLFSGEGSRITRREGHWTNRRLSRKRMGARSASVEGPTVVLKAKIKGVRSNEPLPIPPKHSETQGVQRTVSELRNLESLET